VNGGITGWLSRLKGEHTADHGQFSFFVSLLLIFSLNVHFPDVGHGGSNLVESDGLKAILTRITSVEG